MEDIKHDPAGLRLIEAILKENSWSPLVDNDFSEKDFFGNSLKALSFIRGYYSQYSAFPDSDAVLDEIPNVVFKGNVNTDFAVKTFAKHKLARTLSQIQARSQQFIVNNNPEAAYSFLLEELTQIKPHNTTKSFKQAADARHLEYKKKKLTGFRGVVPPWPTLQKAITVWENGTFNVILGVYSTGKCVEENTLITTGDGSRRTIKEVVENKLDIFSIDPLTGDFIQKTPADWFYSGEKECLEIKFKSKDTLIVSKDHPILTSKGWVKAGDLTEKSIIARTGRLPEPRSVDSDWSHDELTLVAALLADGCLTRSTEVTYTKQDEKLIQLMRDTCSRLDIDFYKRPSQENGCSWTLSTNKTWQILTKYGIGLGKSEFKSLPTKFFSLPDDAIRTFLSVFWSHDGDFYVRKDTGKLIVSMSLSSKELVDNIRQCLLRLGIFSTTSFGRTNADTDRFRLLLPDSEVKKFVAGVPIVKCFESNYRIGNRAYVNTQRNFSKLKTNDNVFWDKVTAIASVGLKRTYDLSVADTHSFEAGYTHVHNSWCSAVAAHHAAFMQQKKVLLVTMENSKSSMESRLDALYHHIPFTDLRQGWIDMRVEKKWLKDIEKLKAEQGDIIVVDGNVARTVGDILQLVNTHEPDFVIVDGAYKLESKGRDMFERSSNLLHSLHHSAEATRVPWLATSQLNPAADKTKHGKDTASEARGNKDWAINPATVMTLTQSNDQRLLNFVECRIAKVREMGSSEGLEMMFLMRQDRQKMLFDEAIDEFVNTEILESLL